MTTTLRPPGNLGQSPSAPSTTGSRGTRMLGAVVLAGLALLAWLALIATPEEQNMGDAVRIIYIHVPAAMVAYISFGVTALGSAMFLWRRSRFWDLAAAASAEIGVLFTALTLLTGSLWGRPTWGVYWVWDARLTSTLLLLLLFLGYLAVRRLDAEPNVRSKRAAIVGLVAFVDVPLVHYSVDWWRSLHQPASLSKLDPDLDGLMLFTLVYGIAAFAALYAWMLMHRFRLEYLREQVGDAGMAQALSERRAEAYGATSTQEQTRS